MSSLERAVGTPGRTHMCGEVTRDCVGSRVTLAGWVGRRRDLGGLIFIDLRDRSGVVQLVFNPELSPQAFTLAQGLRSEFVVRVSGQVRVRPQGTENPAIATGDLEVIPDGLEVLAEARTPPFYLDERQGVDEAVRLRYRYLDLRRPPMQRNLVLRHRFAMAVRSYLDSKGFIEVETPMLTRSTPEGARDFIVPSRLRPGEFYALPQSPQLFKQLLMVSGLDRYFQIARCFRDEDLRADRQPEFTQIDIEMSFVDAEDVMRLTEGLVSSVIEQLTGRRVPTPFRRFTYDEAMDRFGSDKPDTRFAMEIADVSGAVRQCGLRSFADAVNGGGRVAALVVPGCAGMPRSRLDALAEAARSFGAAGLAWLALPAGAPPRGSVVKHLAEGEVGAIVHAAGAASGDLVLMAAGRREEVNVPLGRLRLLLAKELRLVDQTRDELVWVTEFPLMEYSPEEGRPVSMHHPFTAPLDRDTDLLPDRALEARAKAYDLVYNGMELGGGSIRIHRRDVQERVFQALGMSREEAWDKFGFLLEAFEYGTPPHGGIAIGMDRFVMILAGEESMREVIAFPKTQSGLCLMTRAPAPVTQAQLAELKIGLETSAARHVVESGSTCQESDEAPRTEPGQP